MLQCGLYEIDITPPLGAFMPGYGEERYSSGVLDPIYAKAWVIENGDTTLAFLVIDALCILKQEVEWIRERVQRLTGIPPERVLVSATHTHTGPPVRPPFGGVYPQYLDYLVLKAADAVALAYQRRKPAAIGFGRGEEGGISFNRRYWMKDGTVRMNPGFLNPDIVRPTGPIDPEVSVLRIDDLDGNPLGVVTNFACHTDSVGGTAYSSDYPGALSRAIKRTLGEEVVSLFMLGACGDLNHFDTSKPKPAERIQAPRLGRILAEEVLRVREHITLSSEAALKAARTFFPMELRRPTAQEIEKANRKLRGELTYVEEPLFADHILKLVDAPPETAQIEVQTLQIGDWAVVGLPGEIFVELGLALKKESPYRGTIVNTLSNGSIYGYICTREAFEQGGYETRLKLYSRITAGTGERMVEHASGLLRSMKEE